MLLSDHAQLLAESLGIDPGSYAGREGDAVIAMGLVASYPRLSYQDQQQVLYVIGEKMGFETSNPAFFSACQQAIGLIVCNPAWVPGSLSNADLEKEIRFWREVSSVLKFLGFSGVGSLAVNKGKSIFKQMETGSSPRTIMKGLKPGPYSGVVILGSVVQSIASQSVAELEAEADRRGQLGSMTPLTAARYGTTP